MRPETGGQSPAIVAAAVSAAVALVGLLVNVVVTFVTNERRLTEDKKALAERAAFDRQLADRKMLLDRRLVIERRKAELAEQVLTDFYEAQRLFEEIRSPMIWAWEQKPEEGVPEARIRNSGYGVIRRLRDRNEFFSRMDAQRFRAAALFGSQLLDSYNALTRIYNRVSAAAGSLMDHEDSGYAHLREFLEEQRRVAFNMSAGEDPIVSDISLIVADVEKICRPALEADTLPEPASSEAS